MIVNIILYQEAEPYERFMKMELEKWLARCASVVPLFIVYRTNQSEPLVHDQNVLSFRGEEGLIPQVLDKTMMAIQYARDRYQPEFIVRSNISTFIQFYYFPYHELRDEPHGYATTCLITVNETMDYYGTTLRHLGTCFASGTNIILRRDAIETLLQRKTELDRSVIDDVSIGLVLGKPYECVSKMAFNQCVDTFVVRNRSTHRIEDLKRLKALRHLHKKCT